MSDTEKRLRRHLRATSAVNRQLQAQLEGASNAGGSRSATRGGDLITSGSVASGSALVRRSGEADGWLEQLTLLPATAEPFLARQSDGATYLVEGRYRRRVKAGLLATALEARLGSRKDVTDEQMEQWTESAPVEVMECPTGAPFVLVGGQRLPLRGLPLTYPTSTAAAEQFPEGPELNITAKSLASARVRSALAPGALRERGTRAVARHGGLTGAARALVTKISRRLR